MKKLINEVVVIIVLVLAMYLISTSGIIFESGNIKDNTIDNRNYIKDNGSSLITGKTITDSRINKLKKAKENLVLYRLYKRNKLIEPVLVVLDDRSIDINTANAYELTFLNGIGKSLSKRIIAYRVENGVFYYIEDLVKVKGIGQKKLEKILTQ